MGQANVGRGPMTALACVAAACLGATVEGRWRPGIGDPTVMGWVTVAAYLAAAFLCARVARAIALPPPGYPRRGERRQRAFWWLLAAALLVLGVNKQLDLQSALTALGRWAAHAQGWYGARRKVQLVFVLGVGYAGLLVMLGGVWLLWRASRWAWLAHAGFMFVVAFVVMRAASFHHVDQFLGWRVGGLRANVLLELGGLCWVSVAALTARRHVRRFEAPAPPLRKT